MMRRSLVVVAGLAATTAGFGVGCSLETDLGSTAIQVESDSPSTAQDLAATVPTSADERAVVDRVVDGDTIMVELDGDIQRIRLIGIDAPESVTPDVPQECYGPEASAALSQLLPPGTEVWLESDQEPQDRFGRPLRYVYRGDDGLFINQWLTTHGFVESRSYPPNISRQDTLDAAELDAADNDRGMWGNC